MIEIYNFEYSYYDKRHFRKGRIIVRYGKDKASKLYQELLDKMKNKDAKAPIELPHITKLVDGETKLVDEEKEFN